MRAFLHSPKAQCSTGTGSLSWTGIPYNSCSCRSGMQQSSEPSAGIFLMGTWRAAPTDHIGPDRTVLLPLTSLSRATDIKAPQETAWAQCLFLTVATILLTAAADSSSPLGCSTMVTPRYLSWNTMPSRRVSRVSVQFSGSSRRWDRKERGWNNWPSLTSQWQNTAATVSCKNGQNCGK